MRVDKITRVAQSAEGKARDVRHWKRRGAPLALTVLELALQQYERIGSHVGVEQCAVPVISFAAVKHQPIAHRGERLDGAWKKLREQGLRANVALPVRDGRAAAPTNSRRELRGGLGDRAPAGVQAPDMINGAKQLPIDGISMAYTWDDAKAPTRRATQLFEMFGNRGIYHDTWMAWGGRAGASGARVRLGEGQIDHDLAGEPLERPAQVLERQRLGGAEPGVGAEHLDAGEGGAFEAALEFLDIDAERGQRLGDVAHDARPLVAENVEGDQARRRRRLLVSAALDRQTEPRRREVAQGALQPRQVGLGNVDPQNAGELAGEPSGAALEPGPAKGGDLFRHRTDESGPVVADIGQNKRDHGELLTRAAALDSLKPNVLPAKGTL